MSWLSFGEEKPAPIQSDEVYTVYWVKTSESGGEHIHSMTHGATDDAFGARTLCGIMVPKERNHRYGGAALEVYDGGEITCGNCYRSLEKIKAREAQEEEAES